MSQMTCVSLWVGLNWVCAERSEKSEWAFIVAFAIWSVTVVTIFELLFELLKDFKTESESTSVLKAIGCNAEQN